MKEKCKKLFLVPIVGLLATTQISCLASCSNNTYKTTWYYDSSQCQHDCSDSTIISKNKDYVDKITYKSGYVFDSIKIFFYNGSNTTTYTESYNTDKSQLK